VEKTLGLLEIWGLVTGDRSITGDSGKSAFRGANPKPEGGGSLLNVFEESDLQQNQFPKNGVKV